MKPNEDRVVLKPIPAETKTASGFIIPVEAQKIALWEVVSIGDSSQACKVCKTAREQKLLPGMVALINENAGLDFEEEGQPFRIVRFSDIHAYDDKK